MKIRDDLENMKKQYESESNVNWNANAAHQVNQVHYQVKSWASWWDRSGTPVKSERRKSPDTYSIYKKNDDEAWDAPTFDNSQFEDAFTQ